MNSDPRKTSVLGIGPVGSAIAPLAYANGVHGLFDAERAGQEPLKLRNGHNARDVSPTRVEIREAAAGKSRAEADAQNITNLITRAANAEVFKTIPAGELVIAFDDPQPVIAPARAFQKRHRSQRLLAITSPGEDHALGCPVREAARGNNPFMAIWHISTTSPFAEINSQRRQAAFIVNTHNGIAAAPATYEHNPTFGEMIATFGECGPCFASGFASMPLTASGGGLWSGTRRLVGGRYTRSSANLNDVLAQAARATEQALDPGSQTTSEAIDAADVRYVIYIVPLGKGPTLTEFIERQSVWLTRYVPAATPLFAAGNGIPLLEDRGERFLQATVLASMRALSADGQ